MQAGVLGTHFSRQVILRGVLGQGSVGGPKRKEIAEGKGCGVSQARKKEIGQGCKQCKWRRGNSDDRGVGGREDKRSTLRGGTRIGEVLTWTSSEKPVCTEPSKMELRVVPTYNVSPRPSATVRTGPKSSGT